MTEVETSPVILAQFSIASIAGNERAAMDKVARVVAAAGLSIQSLERLQTAVSEATMNAIEHGNRGAPDLPVRVQVQALPKSIVVRVTDYGGGTTAGAEPNLDAKLAGEQSPRGWGLFLIQSMVDEVRFEDSSQSHTVEMVMRRDKKSSPETDSPPGTGSHRR